MNIFTSDHKSSIAVLKEDALHARIAHWLQEVSPPSPEGVGDDAACVARSRHKQQLITTDSVVLNQHFVPETPALKVSSKLLKRNISDLAAMGGRPETAVLALVMSEKVSLDWLEIFFVGLADAASKYGISIVGGDLAAAGHDHFSANLSLLGSCLRPVPRHNAPLGSMLYLTGQFGGSLKGHHLDFEPRIEEGTWLAAQPGVVSMMDMTDGLATDLPRMLGNNQQLELDTTAIPLREAAHVTDWRAALCDGEDYELACFVRPGDAAHLEASWQQRFPELALTKVGQIVEGTPGCQLLEQGSRKPIELDGYQPFYREDATGE